MEKEITIILPGNVPLLFRRIVDQAERAEFEMGSRGFETREEPVHRVVIDQPYYLGVTPVTQAQYRAMAKECLTELEKLKGNEGIEPSQFKGDDLPVEQVDWQDAEGVCCWLSQAACLRSALPAGWIAALPNEAQWEYACRGGTHTEYHSGDGEAALKQVAWYGEEWGTGSTHPVVLGGERQNQFGLTDMHGNVLEWCSDVYDPLAYSKRNDGWSARAWTDQDAGSDTDNEHSDDKSSSRVLRGGSWNDTATDCRSASRDGYWAGGRSGGGGFRVCLFPGPVKNSQPE